MSLAAAENDDIITAANVDLTNCDREVIHQPGLIQPHGVMLVLRPSDLIILQASENTDALFGVPARDLVQQGLDGLLGREQAVRLSAEILQAGERLEGGPFQLLQIVTNDGKLMDALAHRAGDTLLLELELRDPHLTPSYVLADVNACVDRLRSTAGLTDFLDVAVKQISIVSGFDRVMAYKFADDGSGEVVAEKKRDDLTAYLGLHFPAGDIPAPARRMFALSWLRHLPNVDYEPVKLFPETASPVDMSRSILRHVSVMYTSYLKNMRVHATVVMPLMKAGRLWGLVSMHHNSPLHLPCETRTVLEILAQMVSLLMAEQENHETEAYSQRMKDAIADLDHQMAREPVYYRGLSTGKYSLMGWLNASGAALCTDDSVMLFGNTPTESEVSNLVIWLAGWHKSASVFTTDRLPTLYPASETFQTAPRGLLAVRLARNRTDFVMWFRPEIVQTINWAGDPHKPIQVDVIDGQARLSPRGSFDLWKETLPGRSEPWQENEIEAAAACRQAIVEVMLVRLNEELGRSNVELDAFAYVASHDLKEPLRGIHNYANFLWRSAGEKLSEEEQARIATIIRLARRMDDLTDSLMQYSHIGQTGLTFESVDMNDLVQQTLEQLDPRIVETGVMVKVPRDLPVVQSDRMRLAEVLSNLIVNAMKYSDRKKGDGIIEIGWRDQEEQKFFYVRDNGIGIAAKNIDQVFQIFRRLHARDEFGGGSGAGLTIARRTIEKLGGRLWAESEGPGHGSTFWFNLGREPAVAATP
jgi:light-regulated signal transduction histidine kinase (bacteriophytochrome)